MDFVESVLRETDPKERSSPFHEKWFQELATLKHLDAMNPESFNHLTKLPAPSAKIKTDDTSTKAASVDPHLFLSAAKFDYEGNPADAIVGSESAFQSSKVGNINSRLHGYPTSGRPHVHDVHAIMSDDGISEDSERAYPMEVMNLRDYRDGPVFANGVYYEKGMSKDVKLCTMAPLRGRCPGANCAFAHLKEYCPESVHVMYQQNQDDQELTRKLVGLRPDRATENMKKFLTKNPWNPAPRVAPIPPKETSALSDIIGDQMLAMYPTPATSSVQEDFGGTAPIETPRVIDLESQLEGLLSDPAEDAEQWAHGQVDNFTQRMEEEGEGSSDEADDEPTEKRRKTQ